jgi:hypothetical protein
MGTIFKKKQMQTVFVALQILAATALVSANAQTLFTTDDYRNNTVRQIRDMQERERYGEEGSGADLFELQSPYPYTSSDEHYQAWFAAANGGTTHTLELLPDWNGRWGEDEAWLGGGNPN